MPNEGRHWFRIDRAWVERRDSAMRAWEEALIRAARDRATGEDRAFLEALLIERARNAEASRRG